ncbi:MAG: 2-hydroxyacyl-CoA dehydratase [Termitinemataceae bacterium]|nr:MAG: 2-hydroxyacyl-CoA dehydratase [Termitinemataceae bacterium]
MNTFDGCLNLGIDVGSTTVKVVVMDRETQKCVFSRYTRHNAFQPETVSKQLQEILAEFPHAQFHAAICGSGGKSIARQIGTPFIQEVVANSLAIRKFYPAARVAIELGGQDAKVVFFYKDEATGRLIANDMRMNGSCAGGTGAFIDEVATLLKTPAEEFESLAAKGTFVYDISGRCGVFAKTDIQPLLNQGSLREDIALSTFHAIAKQTIGGLAQGLELKPPIIFEGGPLTFNPTLIDVFAERLNLKEKDIIRPANPETIVAYGAALSVDEMFSDFDYTDFSLSKAIDALQTYRDNFNLLPQNKIRAYFNSDDERREFEATHPLGEPAPFSAKKGDVTRVYLGMDIGSTTSKFVLLDENENIVDSFYANNKGEPLLVIKEALSALKKKYDDAGVTLAIIAFGTTGYGELLFDKAFGADYHTVETVAHAAAAAHYVPDVSFILDIGGQDMKAINLSGGIVTNITVNEACSSGCGSFLESFAATLHIPLDKIADAAFSAKNPAELGSRCTVFMNSTIITEQKNGKTAGDIMAGLCRSIIENVFTKVVRLSNFAGMGEKIVVQGGTFRNNAVLRAIEQYLGKPVVRAPYTGLMGAIGVALLTKRHIAENGYTSPHGPKDKSRFIGLDAIENFSYHQETNLRCGFCGNNCNRTLITFSNGTTWVTGNRCERGEIVGSTNDPALQEVAKKIGERLAEIPDMVSKRNELLFKEYPFTPVCADRNITIGLPRVLDFWRTMPFWTVFFHALGFKTKISKPSSRVLFEKGLPFVASDTVCFPAKLVHGHIQYLAEKKVDRIFMPILGHLPADNLEKESTYTCPVLKGYPIVIRFSDNPARRWDTPFDMPMFHWFKIRDRNLQLCRYMKETFGISVSDTRNALKQADNALASFNNALKFAGQKIIDDVQRQGKFAVVLAGRDYQFDDFVNHQLSRYFTNVGIPVLTIDSLPDINDVDLSKVMPDINNSNHARILAGAILSAQHPALEYVEIYSFGCGHDAIYTDEVTRLMAAISGKTPLILKLDESDVAGPLRIRVRSFIETVQIRRAKEKLTIHALGDPFPVKFNKKDKYKKTILIPNVSVAFCKIIAASIRQFGINAVALPMGDKEARALGKRYVHNDSCFPAQMIIGETLLALRSGQYKPEDVVVGTGKFLCDCRLTNYMVLARRALDDAGYANVPIQGTDFFDAKNLHPAFRFNYLIYARGSWCMIMSDVLENLRHKIRPYELHKGDTDAAFDVSIDEICHGLETKSFSGAFAAYKKAINRFCAIRYDRTHLKPLVFITGEYLLTFHSGTNFFIEQYLEDNNMEVDLPWMFDVYRNIMLFHTVSEVKDFGVRHNLQDTLFAFGGEKFADTAINIIERVALQHPLYTKALPLPEQAKLSEGIIPRSIQSGEGFLMAADILHRAQHGVKSFIIVQPFGCLPNHFCGRGIIKHIKELHPDIQILPLDYDPDTSFANIENRLQMLIMNTRPHNNAA